MAEAAVASRRISLCASVSRVPHITWRYLCLFIHFRSRNQTKTNSMKPEMRQTVYSAGIPPILRYMLMRKSHPTNGSVGQRCCFCSAFGIFFHFCFECTNEKRNKHWKTFPFVLNFVDNFYRFTIGKQRSAHSSRADYLRNDVNLVASNVRRHFVDQKFCPFRNWIRVDFSKLHSTTPLTSTALTHTFGNNTRMENRIVPYLQIV